MEQAVGRAAASPHGITVNDPLDELRWHWGDAYEIERADDGWRARRRDGLGGWMTAPSAEELRDRIRGDYRRRPVRRPRAEARR